MEGLAVTLKAPVASFRRPLDLNFQRTLLLPPPTTCLGIAGAALGLSDRELWAPPSPLRSLKVAVLMEPSYVTSRDPAVSKDLWKIMKIKKNKKITIERSPYFRELLFFVRYTLLFTASENLLSQLEGAFLDPVYPLSLGREDELALVEKVRRATFTRGIPIFRGTIVPGDFREMKVRVRLSPGIRIEPPSVEKLPTEFKLDKGGIRQPLKPKVFTFIPWETRMEIPDIEAYAFEDRNFTWLNS